MTFEQCRCFGHGSDRSLTPSPREFLCLNSPKHVSLSLDANVNAATKTQRSAMHFQARTSLVTSGSDQIGQGAPQRPLT
jgi:hypothetical protein